jgi:hypothetical protein
MASVIERLGTVVKDGLIHHDDRLATYEQADKLAGCRLDRRRSYAIIDGEVCELAEWSQACSGCYQGYDSAHAVGSGCDECGHTGRRKHSHWVPRATVDSTAKP